MKEATIPAEENNEATVQKPAEKVNDVSMNASIGQVLVPATQYHPHETSPDEN